MVPDDVVSLFENDTALNLLLASIDQNPVKIKLKGLSGSADAINLLAVSKKTNRPILVILHDKEEANLLINDLFNLNYKGSYSLFPTSYKTPYQFDLIDNANILQRSETLNHIMNTKNHIVLTYPEALVEKVLNKRSLIQNTFKASVGESVDVEFLSELFITYGFEGTDFVYEPGQFAVRGGIVDVYSYSSAFPYRLELFGNEIESIRQFDPESQLSRERVKEAMIMPNTQTRMLKEERISLLNYLPVNALIWIKDLRETEDIIARGFEKATHSFEEILKISNETKVIDSPELLFETPDTFTASIKNRTVIEFGKRSFLKTSIEIDFATKPQPSFNKNFELLA